MKSAKRVVAIQPLLDSIRRRRNEWLAHLDPRTVIDPKVLSEAARLTIPDLERAFEGTEEILVELSASTKA